MTRSLSDRVDLQDGQSAIQCNGPYWLPKHGDGRVGSPTETNVVSVNRSSKLIVDGVRSGTFR